MYITRIRLENFKRHKELEREFSLGVNAIYGPNGAGKTSIIEAIGFALFDFHPYRKQADLLHHGTRKATIQVEFVGSDDRVYLLERTMQASGGGDYQLFDKDTSSQICEKKEDVQDRLRGLMQLDPETNLKDLYSGILGVPQGTMTAAFLTSPRDRERVFDPLLQVAIYQRAKDNMYPTFLQPLKGEITELQITLGRLEESVRKLPDLQREGEQLRHSLQRNQKEHGALREQEPAATQTLQSLEALRDKLQQRDAARQQLQQEQQHLETRHSELNKQRSEAEQAHAIVERDNDGYQQHAEAQNQLRELRQQEQRYREQHKALKDSEHQLQRVQDQQTVLNQQWQELLGLEDEFAKLRPLLDEQKQLQQQREQCLQARTHAERLDRELRELEREIQDLRQQSEQKVEWVKQLEQYVPLEARLHDITREGKELAAQIVALENTQRERERLLQELQKLDEAIATRRQQIEQKKQELHTLERRYQPQAEQFAFHEENLQRLQRQMVQLESRREREQQFSREVSGGVCPYFQQPCRNVPAGQQLDDFLESQVQRKAEDLQQLRRQIEETQRSRDAAQRAQHKLTHDGAALQAQIQSAEQELLREEREHQSLQATLRQHPDCRAGIAEKEQRRLALRDEYKELDPKVRQAQSLESERANLRDIQRRLEQKRSALTQKQTEKKTLEEQAQQLPALEERLQAIQASCQRGTYCSLRLLQKPQLEEQRGAIAADVQRLTTQCEQQREALATFGDLERSVRACEQTLETTQEAYKAVLAHQRLAQRLPEIQERLEALTTQQTQTTQAFQAAEQECQQLRREFDPNALTQARQKKDELTGRLRELARDIEHESKRLQQVESEIEALTQAQEALHDKRERFAQLTRIQTCSQFIRGIYDRAKPEITRLLIESISEEAGRIFSHLVDNHRLHLNWLDEENDRYALIVEEEGQERSFANLSGGEQMAAALSLRMALIKELSSVRVAFLDEPTAHMDTERRRNLASQISEIQGFKQLFVISHDDTFDSQVHNTVRVP